MAPSLPRDDYGLISRFLLDLEQRLDRSPRTIEAYEKPLLRLAEFLAEQELTLLKVEIDNLSAFVGRKLHDLQLQPRSRQVAIAGIRQFF